jgi:hypothetical protein
MACEAPGLSYGKNVVTCFLLQYSRILLLKRSFLVGTFRGKWFAVSGYIETDADKQSLIEINEETGLLPEDLILQRKGLPMIAGDKVNGIFWIVHPYL